MRRTPDNVATLSGWRAVVGVILLVLLVGILAVQFVPVERLRGWPLYIAGALLLTGVAVELFFFGVEALSMLADGLEWISRIAAGGRGKRSR